MADWTPVHAWLRRAAGDEGLKRAIEKWEGFDADPAVVVTLLGEYNTGKSSLLRRLLADDALPVPGDVSVGAAPESFTSKEVGYRGGVLRDTPGVRAGAAGLNADATNARAWSAAALTDVLVLVATPSGIKGARDLWIRLGAAAWPQDAVLHVLSRFDEAGTSPSNTEGYEALKRVKTQEYRSALGLAEAIGVHAVAADHGGLGAFTPDPTRATWDHTREWDGVEELAARLGEVVNLDGWALRDAAQERFWRSQVDTQVSLLETALNESEASLQVARGQLARRQLLESQLNALAEAASAALEGAVEDAIRSATIRQTPTTEMINSAIGQALARWWSGQHLALARIVDDALAEQIANRSRPAFQIMFDRYRAISEEEAPTGAQPFSYRVSTLGGQAVSALRSFEEARQKHRESMPGRRHRPAPNSVEWSTIGEIALPIVIELARLWESNRASAEAARAAARRSQELADEVKRLVKQAAESDHAAWMTNLTDSRHLIRDLTLGADDVDSFEAEYRNISTLIDDGRRLIGGGYGVQVQA